MKLISIVLKHRRLCLLIVKNLAVKFIFRIFALLFFRGRIAHLNETQLLI